MQDLNKLNVVDADPLVVVPCVQQLHCGQVVHPIPKSAATKRAGVVYDSGWWVSVKHGKIYLPSPEVVARVGNVEWLKVDGVQVDNAEGAASTLQETEQTQIAFPPALVASVLSGWELKRGI